MLVLFNKREILSKTTDWRSNTFYPFLYRRALIFWIRKWAHGRNDSLRRNLMLLFGKEINYFSLAMSKLCLQCLIMYYVYNFRLTEKYATIFIASNLYWWSSEKNIGSLPKRVFRAFLKRNNLNVRITFQNFTFFIIILTI